MHREPTELKAKDTLGGTPTNRYRIVATGHEPHECALDECIESQTEDSDVSIQRLYAAHDDDLTDGTWIEVSL